MSQNNSNFIGKPLLDKRVEEYSEEVYRRFDYDRRIGKAPLFGRFYYPAMVASCTDSNQKMFCDSMSHIPSVKEYEVTKMMDEMIKTFGLTIPVTSKEMKSKSHKNYSIGQCAEQHAANELLNGLRQEDEVYYGKIDLKKDIFFSKAIRPSTGEVFTYCQNCNVLFDL